MSVDKEGEYKVTAWIRRESIMSPLSLETGIGATSLLYPSLLAAGIRSSDTSILRERGLFELRVQGRAQQDRKS